MPDNCKELLLLSVLISNIAAFLWKFIQQVLIKQLLFIILDTRQVVGTQRLMQQSPCPQGAYWPAGENKIHLNNSNDRKTVTTTLKAYE